MDKYVKIDDAWKESSLIDWYITSVSGNPPVWTPEHISELCKDFYVIPKEAHVEEAVPAVHAHWIEKKATGGGTWDYYFICSNCGHETPVRGYTIAPDFCPGCRAIMDERTDNNGTTDS